MSTDEKYSCTDEFWAELGMYIGVFITTISQFSCRSLQSAVDTALLTLMSYLLSMEKQSNLEGRAQVILIWIVLVEVNRIGYNPIKSYKLDKSLKQLLRLFWVGYVVYTSTPIQGIKASLFVLVIYFFGYEIVRGKVHYKFKNSPLMGKNPTLINNYLKSKMQESLQTTPLKSCDYIVMGEQNYEIEDSSHGYPLSKKKSNSGDILTIGEVFKEKLPTRYTATSLALAKMLMQRFAKIPADEAGRSKALDFVLEGLIKKIGGYRDTQTERNRGKSNKMERVFGIIDEELRIVYDILEVKMPVYHYLPWYAKTVLLGLLLVLADGIYLICAVIQRSYAWLSLEEYNHCFFHAFGSGSVVMKILPIVDAGITIILWFPCIIILIRESKAMVKSQNWCNLKSHERYLQNPANFNRNRSYSSEAPSEKELPQAHGKIAKKDRKYSSVLDPSLLPKSIKIKLPKPFLRAFVSADAKEAVLTFLAESRGQLTNGETSLKRYGMKHLNWACQPNVSNTEAILVWHIATTRLQQNNAPNQESSPQENNKPFTKEVALSLSSYCHYLVLCLPELLPDDVKWTKKRYANVMKDIKSIPWSTDRCKYAQVFKRNQSTVVEKGDKLAQELMNCAGKHVWTMLARFWAEMMLFIAPSDNVEGHAKYLHLNEKEFITQLWALLTHAGIINRPKPTEHQGDKSERNADTEERFHGIMVYRNPSAI